MNARGQYGNQPGSLQPWRMAAPVRTRDVRLGADNPTSSYSLHLGPLWFVVGGLGLYLVAHAVGSAAEAAGAAKKAANALWAHEEDRSWRQWLRTPKEERRKWPEERAAWNAWEFEVQRIDDRAEEADAVAERAAKVAKKHSR